MRYDLVIIGAGPAGLSACLYALRFKLNVLLADKMQPGGYLGYIDKLENYPGFGEGISGVKFTEAILAQLKKYDYKFQGMEFRKITAEENNYWRLGSDQEEISTKSLIIAVGSQPKGLGIKGEKEFTGRGVSFCAVCDAPFFKNKEVAVIGGGNTAAEESLYLSQYASKVTLIHRRDTLRADQVLQERIAANPKIETILDSECLEIRGERAVSGLKLKNNKTAKVFDFSCQGVFVFAGMVPATDLFKGMVRMDDSGQIITDVKLATDKPGIFAAGDCRQTPLRQVITACADGALAAYSAKKYLEAV